MVLAFPPRQEGSKTELQDDIAQFMKFSPARELFAQATISFPPHLQRPLPETAALS
jgi:hypothetical protein